MKQSLLNGRVNQRGAHFGPKPTMNSKKPKETSSNHYLVFGVQVDQNHLSVLERQGTL